MNDLIKEFRELLSLCQKSPLKIEYWDRVDLKSGGVRNIEPSAYDVKLWEKAHNDLPKLLDELEENRKLIDAQDYAVRRNARELDRYKKALEKCKSHRNYLLVGNNVEMYMGMGNGSKDVADMLDKEIEQILKGEGSDD